MILLIIIFSNILLNLLIVFTYYFIFIGLYSQYKKSYLSIIKNWLFYIALLRNISIIIILLKRAYFSHYFTIAKY